MDDPKRPRVDPSEPRFAWRHRLDGQEESWPTDAAEDRGVDAADGPGSTTDSASDGDDGDHSGSSTAPVGDDDGDAPVDSESPPASTDDPVSADDPVSTADPASTDDPVSTADPVSADEPVDAPGTHSDDAVPEATDGEPASAGTADAPAGSTAEQGDPSESERGTDDDGVPASAESTEAAADLADGDLDAMLASDDAADRLAACRALAADGGPEARSRLADLRLDPNPEVSDLACEALEELD